MNTKPTATPSVVASLQKSAKDFNFQSVCEAVKASKLALQVGSLNEAGNHSQATSGRNVLGL